MRDELLFEQYGGRVAAEVDGEEPTPCDDGLGEESAEMVPDARQLLGSGLRSRTTAPGRCR